VSSKKQRRRGQQASRNRRSGRAGLILAALAIALGSFLVFSRMFQPRHAGVASPRPTPPETNSGSASNFATAAAHGTTKATEDGPKPETSQDYINMGTDLFAQGRYAEAAEAYASGVKLAPEDETAHFNFAVALARMGKLEEAKREYEEALRLFPDYGEVHNNLGNLLASQGQFPAAIEHLQAAVQATPDSASAHNNLGRVLILRGDRPGALKHFAEAVRLTPDYLEARCNLGNAYLAEGKTNEAAAQFTAALELKPGFDLATRGLARARGQGPATDNLPPIPLRVD
jgi:Flp pilus assembly protein TadD